MNIASALRSSQRIVETWQILQMTLVAARRNHVTWTAILALLAFFSSAKAMADEMPRQIAKPQSVRIAGIVLKWLRGDKEANYRRVEPLIREAAGKGAQIVCTTECFLDGYAIADKSIPLEQYRALGEPIPQGEYFRKLASLAKELRIFLIAGMLEADGERRFNTAALIGPQGELIGKYHKQQLEHEAVRNTAGNQSSVFDTPFGKLGVMICADRRFPDVVKGFCERGAEFLICPSGGMFGPKSNDHILQARSKENGKYIVFVHPAEFLATGPEGTILEQRLLGDKLVISPNQIGTKADSQQVLYFEMPLTPRTKNPSQIELSIVERSGVSRQKEPVTSGVPFPKGELRSAENVRLLRDGQEVPAQFRAAGLWRPDDSIRWLLVDFQTDLAAKARQTYTIEYGTGVSAKAKPQPGVRIEENDDGYLVDTGAARFDINKRAFDLFREVRLVDGIIVVPRPDAAEPRFGAVLRGVKAMVTRAIPDPANQGRSHLIHVVSSPSAGLEDYTLRFTSPREYQVAGAKSGLVGNGAYLKDFTSKDGLVSIPAGAWLNYAYPAPGDVYYFRTIPAGSAVVSENVWKATVLERGPMRSVIRLKGSFGPPRAPVLEFTAWYHFYAGSAEVKLSFTLENNNHGGRTPDGNARNADIGGVNCVFFDAMNLRVPLKLEGTGRVCLGGSTDDRPLAAPLNARAEIYQDSSGGAYWNRYVAAEFHPRPNSYVNFKGYRVFTGEDQVAAGDRALGWIDVSDAAKGLTVSVADFWQNYPKALSAGTDGTVEIGLFPGRYAADFPLRSGEHKTHEILFIFHSGTVPDDGNKTLARAFTSPLRLEPSPQWFARTRALGDLHPFDVQNYRAYEVRNLSAIGEFPEGVQPGPSLLSRREENEFYSWMDYGDVPIDFEAPSGQWGMKYDLDYVMAQQWARTLNPKWWDLFLAADRHTRDIDIHHQPHYPGLHFVKGGVWAHSTHAEPGHKNPHRNYNHFTKDLCFGARGTAALYYLTGDWKSHEACLEIAENALAEYMSPQRNPGLPERNNRMGWRGDGCTLHRLLEGYLLSGEEKYLQRARWQIKSCAFDGKPPKHEPISLWSSLFYMEALARYVEIFPDDAPAKAYLLAHADTLRKSIHQENGIFYTITPHPDGSVTGNGDCSHYNIMAADILAFAYRLTGRAEFLAAARRCFTYGVKNANGRNSPPTFYQVHSANGAMHGNAFMVVDSAERSR